MESMNKFKVLTIVVICMFIFVIAAIYSNTKDASTQKEKMTQRQTEEKIVKEVEYADKDFAKVVNDVNILSRQVEELTNRINNKESGENIVRCKILGTLSDGGVEELSENAAVQDAKINNNPLVITCRL